MTLVVVPDISAEAITRIGNSRTTSIKVNNNKHAKSRVGNGRTIDQKQPSHKISGHLVQHSVNKPPIPNQQNPYAVFILTFDF
ncbi:hypothetical protein [uncultured Nostoc sp.]|uniref:hypothetical protein n=1 Tax=uncultured Nostoc sp. TaxID=340711 RepID=UPI0035C95C21